MARKTLKDWYNRYFSNPEVLILVVLLAVGFLLLTWMGETIAPVLASVVIAYFLSSLVTRLNQWGLPRTLAVWLVYLVFLAGLIVAVFGLLPLLWQQLTNLTQELPKMVQRGQTFLMQLPAQYPDYVTPVQVHKTIALLKTNLSGLGRWAVSFSLSSITGFIVFTLYLVLVPLLVYFFLKDQKKILQWVVNFLPPEHDLLSHVWQEMHAQIGNYIRGKGIEILIVSGITYVVFAMLGLPYAVLLSVGVGLSVIIPYIGAVLITIPVIVVGLMRWGLETDFFNLLIAYTIIITLDANLLVPILFSETMDLHPVAIIVSILVFGALWGFWGIFFAIPLATLVKAVLALIEKNNTLDEAVTSLVQQPK